MGSVGQLTNSQDLLHSDEVYTEIRQKIVNNNTSSQEPLKENNLPPTGSDQPELEQSTDGKVQFL